MECCEGVLAAQRVRLKSKEETANIVDQAMPSFLQTVLDAQDVLVLLDLTSGHS